MFSLSIPLILNGWDELHAKDDGEIMEKLSFETALRMILDEDSRYDEQAYLFMREALDHTIQTLDKPVDGPGRHVSGGELLDGIRAFAVDEYGPITRTVLEKWGVTSTRDFGNIVFNLVDKGILGKTEEDTLEDFLDGYTFDEAFHKPFLPSADAEAESPSETAHGE